MRLIFRFGSDPALGKLHRNVSTVTMIGSGHAQQLNLKLFSCFGGMQGNRRCGQKRGSPTGLFDALSRFLALARVRVGVDTGRG